MRERILEANPSVPAVRGVIAGVLCYPVHRRQLGTKDRNKDLVGDIRHRHRFPLDCGFSKYDRDGATADWVRLQPCHYIMLLVPE